MKLKEGYNLFSGDEHKYIINVIKNTDEGNLHFLKVNKNNIVPDMLGILDKLNVGSLLVEGGAQTLNSFISEELWDEARIFTSEKNFEEGINAPALVIDDVEEQNILGDRLSIIYNPKTQVLWQKN